MFYSLISLLLIFIWHKSHRSSDINPEHNWNPCESSSSTNGYHGPQRRSYYQTDTCNKHQQYLIGRTTGKVTSVNVHDKGKMDNKNIIQSDISNPYKKQIPVIPLGTEYKCI